MDQLAKVGPFAALIRLWNELSGGQRVVVTAFAALSLVTIVIIGMAASRPRMSVLFSGLESEDAGAIVQKLSEQKVPYKVSTDGSTVEVPENKVYDLRLGMATQGLPQGGNVGFELFDKSSFGMTEFTEKLNYQRAIQGELTRTIRTLAPVINARVHIAIPEDKLYASEQEPPTASIVLKLRRGMPLGDDQVGGIVHLVASAVDGLEPSNVTVIDSAGNVLSEGKAGSDGAGGMMTSNQAKMKRQYESELAQNLQTMLTRIVGPDKAVVRVSADMSFDQTQSTSETYEPAGTTPGGAQGVLQSEEKKSEIYSGGVMPPAGVPAAAARARTGSSGDNYTRTESTSQYQVTKTTKEVVSAPGQLSRLSVAVLVDDKVDITKLSAIKEAVTAAAGIDATRKDQVTVQRVAFDTMAQKQEDAAAAGVAKSDMIGSVARNAGAVVLLLAFLFFLRSIVKQIRVQAPAAPTVAQPVVPIQYAEAGQRPVAATYAPSEPPASRPEQFGPAPVPIPEGVPKDVADSTPEELARLVKSWMSES